MKRTFQHALNSKTTKPASFFVRLAPLVAAAAMACISPSALLGQPVQDRNADGSITTWASGNDPAGHVPYHPQVTAFFCGAASMEMELDCNAVRNNNPAIDVMLGNGVAGGRPPAAVVDGAPTLCLPGMGICWTQPGNLVAVGGGSVPTAGVQSFIYSLVHGGFPGNYTWNGFNYINPSPGFGGFGPGQGTSLDELTVGLNLMDSPGNNAGIHNYVGYNVLPQAALPDHIRTDWANRTMADALAQLGIPAIAMINRGAHWICVIGVKTDVVPVANGAYKIYGFYIRDPATGYLEAQPNYPNGRPILDRNGKPLRGLGPQKFCSTRRNPNRGNEDDVDWDSIFDPASGPPTPFFGSGFGYKFEVEPIGPVALDTGNNGQYNSIPSPSSILTNAPISPDEALAFATNALASDLFLSSQPGFTNGFWDLANALRVRHATDGTNQGDWLLPYEGSGGTNDVTGFVMIDVETGDLDEAVWMNPGDLIPHLSLSEAQTMETQEFAGVFPDDNSSNATLNIQTTDTNSIILSWPASTFITYSVQQTLSLNNPNWLTLTNTPDLVSGMNQLVLPKTAQKSFFRLSAP